MIRLNCEQGSLEWHQARLGIPTASEFHRIVTPKGKMSAQASEYMHVLLAEWIIGTPLPSIETEWMQRGHELEKAAFQAYEFERDCETEAVGFITTDDGMIGASPDRLVIGKPRGLELKCPSPHVHVGHMVTRAIDEKHKPQVQGQMLVAELDAVDVQSYCPGLPTVVIEAVRDEPYIKTLSEALRAFVNVMLEARLALEKQYGPFTRQQPKPVDPLGLSAADVDAIVAERFPKQ